MFSWKQKVYFKSPWYRSFMTEDFDDTWITHLLFWVFKMFKFVSQAWYRHEIGCRLLTWDQHWLHSRESQQHLGGSIYQSQLRLHTRHRYETNKLKFAQRWPVLTLTEASIVQYRDSISSSSSSSMGPGSGAVDRIRDKVGDMKSDGSARETLANWWSQSWSFLVLSQLSGLPAMWKFQMRPENIV